MMTSHPSEKETTSKEVQESENGTPSKQTKKTKPMKGSSKEMEPQDSNPIKAEQIEALMKKMNKIDLLNSLTGSTQTKKDIEKYKFWSTQPVPAPGKKRRKENTYLS